MGPPRRCISARAERTPRKTGWRTASTVHLCVCGVDLTGTEWQARHDGASLQVQRKETDPRMAQLAALLFAASRRAPRGGPGLASAG